MPGRRSHAPAASDAWKLNQAETNRAELVLALLKNVSPADLQRVGGSKRKLRSIIKMFEQRGHCQDAPRSGRPVKYSEAQMRTAIMYLVQHQDTLLTMPTLINQLMAEGLLHSAPDIPTFTAHLKAEVRNMGHQLNTKHTQTTFILLDTDKEARLAYAKDLKAYLQRHPLDMLVFVDETQLATGAHPKAQKRLPPHLHIKGLMTPATRFHTAKESRRVVNAAVALSLAGGVCVKEVTGTQYPGCPPLHKYTAANGKPAKCMGQDEYSDFLEHAWRQFNQHMAFRHQSAEALLIHDRNRVHSSKVVQQRLQSLGIKSMLAPPRSPDLMPLDYGVFGSIKLQLGRGLPRTAPWEQRARKFLELLRQRPSDRVIQSFEERLDACIRAHGGYIE